MVDSAKAVKKPKEATAAAVELNAPKLYSNRELSNLEYFHRVLVQATEARHPLLERIFFLAIVSSSLDEFFMVRVSDLMDLVDAGLVEFSPDGMSPTQQLVAIRRRVIELFAEQQRIA